jgi:UDP:flavonoid glycosyltransferase YjiC (YdhE family)
MLLNHISDDFYESVDGNLWNAEPECIKWLDSKEPGSVIYVSFGSSTITTAEELVELAWGLADSKHNFLWIIRPDLIKGDSAILPQDFLFETKEKGFVASWCPQEQVLNHPSIGGFLTHCGWNSMIESISAGVPMICWPFFGDQFANSRKSCNEWGIGLELRDGFIRDEVENIVNEILIGEKGKKVKKRVLEWKKMAEEATGFDGSSSLNLNNLVNEVLLSKS